MKNRIAFICLNPWEVFLSHRFFCHVKEYYDWFCDHARLMNLEFYFTEKVEAYGEPHWGSEDILWGDCSGMQAMYIQCSHFRSMEKFLDEADLLVIGMPYNKKLCDKIFLSIFPWKEKSIFLWDGRIAADTAFLQQCRREYLLEEKQLVQTKSFCHLGRSFYL